MRCGILFNAAGRQIPNIWCLLLRESGDKGFACAQVDHPISENPFISINQSVNRRMVEE